jgi:hypothetical protein
MERHYETKFQNPNIKLQKKSKTDGRSVNIQDCPLDDTSIVIPGLFLRYMKLNEIPKWKEKILAFITSVYSNFH